jgi:hypothetical protein
VFFARNNDLKKHSSKYGKWIKAYSDAVKKLQDDPTYAFAEAKKYYGQGLSDATLHGVLDFYLKQEWAQTQFTQQSYDATKDVLLNSDSGFTSSNIPGFDDVTKQAPSS